MRRALAACCIACAVGVPAAAQSRGPRVSVSVNAGGAAAAPSARERFTFDLHAEAATVNADYRARAALLVDGGFAVRFRGGLALGIAVSRSGGDGRAGIVAQIPYPFDFGRFREVTGTSSALDRSEIAYHAQVLYSRPILGRLRLVLSGGPTFFSARRQVVDEVQVDESYPYDTATFRAATVRALRGTGVGAHGGADFIWMLNRRIGVGAFARYTRGTADLKAPSRTVSIDTGGLQSGLGLRMFF